MIENRKLPNALNGPGENEKIRMKEKYTKKTFEPLGPDLLTAIRNGDHKAFQGFYLDTVEIILDFVNLLVHSEAESEEICQQIYVNIWENRSKIDPSANFKGYLYKMAKSAALQCIARRKVENNYVNYRLNDGIDFGESPDELVITSEIALLINIYLESMPQQRRTVFEMSRNQGLNNDEIAKKLNITSATVRSHLSHATKGLRELLMIFALFFISQ